MKVKFCLAALLSLLFLPTKAQNNIAVLDFEAGVGILQSDVDGLYAIFTTYFTPEGYSMIEREQINRAIKEQQFQQSSYTKEQIAEMGRILGVHYIVTGNINIVMGQYNMDVRVIHTESGTITAKAGLRWKKGTSYRQRMRKLAKKLAKKMPPTSMEVVVEAPKEKKEIPEYRPVEPSLRFSVGAPTFASVAYNYPLNSSFMVGGGIGFGAAGVRKLDYNHHIAYYDAYSGFGGPLYLEAEVRTPRYAWSLFLNAKLGYIIHPFNFKPYSSYEYSHLMTAITGGVSYQDFHLGLGWAHNTASTFAISLSYNLPLKKATEAVSSKFF
ncbi:MAG: hypothetical protein J5873_06215 [Bacteroidales bacterium]|nr:hypothetical protein [Bacteroidales bacterium]